jgi:integrase
MPEYRLTRLRGVLAITFTAEDGKRRRISTGESDPIKATRFMDRWLREMQRPKDVAINMILDNYMTHLQGKASAEVARHQAKPLRAAFGKILPMQITKAKVAAYVAERQKAGKSAATIRSEVVLLSSAINRAVKDYLITERPHIETPSNSPPRDLFMERADFERFLAECRAYHVKLFVLLAIATGARASAILELTWDRVDFAAGTIDLRVPKVRAMKGRAIVPMTNAARAALSQSREVAVSEYVIEHGGKPMKRITKGIAAAAERSGLPWVTPHVFRHSAAVWMMRETGDIEQVAEYLGHENSEVTRRVYAKYGPQWLRKASAALEIGSLAPPSTMYKTTAKGKN